MRPLVAVTCDRRALGPVAGAATRVRPARPEVFVGERVIERLRSAGFAVVLLPPGDPDGGADILGRADALVVTGGAFDIHPRHYGQAVTARLDRTDEDRTALELRLCRAAIDRRLPVLGLCGGMQALVVAAGGTLLQHVEGHEQPTDPALPWHALLPEPNAPAGLAAMVLGHANSTHHQAVDSPGSMGILARAPDGVVEAVWLPDHPFCVGLQGHPELLDDRPFAALAAAACGAGQGAGSAGATPPQSSTR
jgi:putative glutamine amidotransferase